MFIGQGLQYLGLCWAQHVLTDLKWGEGGGAFICLHSLRLWTKGFLVSSEGSPHLVNSY